MLELGTKGADATYPFPQPRNPQPPKDRARSVLERVRGGKQNWGANENWQVRAMMVMADGERDHFLNYVQASGGSYRDGVRVEKLGVAIYQDVGKFDGKQEGMDRELVRDYVLKPLVELGVVVECTWARKGNDPTLLVGHPKAKSPNCVYRLDDPVLDLLDTKRPYEFDSKLAALVEALPERVRDRISIHEAVRSAQALTPHGLLIEQCLSAVEKCVSGFDRVFVDVTDGTRITKEDEHRLRDSGLSLTLSDTIPDVILANRSARAIIAIEAVTSDGEFDQHRFERLTLWVERHGYESLLAITAYPDHATFAKRQAKHKNIADGTCIWLADQPDTVFSKDSLRVRLDSVLP